MTFFAKSTGYDMLFGIWQFVDWQVGSFATVIWIYDKRIIDGKPVEIARTHAHADGPLENIIQGQRGKRGKEKGSEKGK